VVKEFVELSTAGAHGQKRRGELAPLSTPPQTFSFAPEGGGALSGDSATRHGRPKRLVTAFRQVRKIGRGFPRAHADQRGGLVFSYPPARRKILKGPVLATRAVPCIAKI
jgi:hypothetical protein